MNSNKSVTSNIEAFVIDTLANVLGVVPEDISPDDDLKEDLHMGSSEITDFIHSLENHGYTIDVSKIADIETVSDVIETISDEEEF